MLASLRQPFTVEQVKKNADGLDYVSIDGYISRLLDVLGTGYDFRITRSELVLLPEDMKTRSGKRQYLANVTGELSLHGKHPATNGMGGTFVPPTVRAGVGADVSFDPDKALKTAQAEALKKAAHQFGIALELWDEEHRTKLEKQRTLTTDAAIKREVWKIARERTGKDKPTAAEVARVFGKKAGELADTAVLREILVSEGVL